MTEQKSIKKPHNIIMNNCEKLSLTGINDVGSFDENAIHAYTDKGRLTIKGEGLKVENVNTTIGDMEVTGHITALVYSDEVRRRSLVSKLMK